MEELLDLDTKQDEVLDLDGDVLDLDAPQSKKWSAQKSTSPVSTDTLNVKNISDISSRRALSGGPNTLAQEWGGTPVAPGMPAHLDEVDKERNLSVGLSAAIGGTAETLKSTGIIAKIVGKRLQEPGPLQGNLGKFATKAIGSALEKGGQNAEDYYKSVSEEFPQPKEFVGKNPVDNPEILADPRWWADTVGRTVPSLAATIVPAAGGARAISYGGKVLNLAPKVISRLSRMGAAITGGSVGGGLEASGTYEEALRMGKTEEEAIEAAKEMFFVSAALNALSVDKALGSVSGSWIKKAANQIAKGGVEATTEWAEGPAEALILGKDVVQATKEETAVLPASFLIGMLVPGASSTRRPAPESYNDWKGKIQFIVDKYSTKDRIEAIRKDRDSQFAKDIQAVKELDATSTKRTPAQEEELKRQHLAAIGKQNAKWMAEEIADTETQAWKETQQAEQPQATETQTAKPQPTAAEEPELLDLDDYNPTDKALEVRDSLVRDEQRLGVNKQKRLDFVENLRKEHGVEYKKWLEENIDSYPKDDLPLSVESWFHKIKEPSLATGGKTLTISELRAKELAGYETAKMPEEVTKEDLGDPISGKGKYTAIAAVETPDGVFASENHAPLSEIVKSQDARKGFFIAEAGADVLEKGRPVTKVGAGTGRFVSLQELDAAGADVYTALQNKKAGFLKRTFGSERGAAGDLSPAPMFYSQLEKVVEAKLGKFEYPDTIQKILANPQLGIKADELNWSSFGEWLKEQPKGSKIPKEKVLEFIRENNIEVKEKVLGGGLSPAKISALKQYVREVNRANDELLDKKVTLAERNANAKEIQASLDLSDEDLKFIDDATDKITEGTRHGHANWNTPGGTNRRELILTVPSIEPYASEDTTHFGDVVGDKTIAGATRSAVQESGGREIIASGLSIDDAAKIAERNSGSQVIETFAGSGIFNVELYKPKGGEGRAIAWARIADFTDSEGKKVLLVDEVQSKRGQEGRERGFNSEKDVHHVFYKAANGEKIYLGHGYTEQSALGSVDKGWRDAEKKGIVKLETEVEKVKDRNAVPPMPFSKTWHEVVMKRVLRYATENGYDKVAWTTGEQQAERYDLSKQLKGVRAEQSSNGNINIGYMEKGSEHYLSGIDDVSPKDLPGVVGKELAAKILQDVEKRSGVHEYTGLDLKVGGEGMKDFYDPEGRSSQNIAKFLDKYTKKWGGEVSQSEITTHPADKNDKNFTGLTTKVHSLSITPAMKSEVMYKGQALFDVTSLLDPKVIAEHVRVLKETAGDVKKAMPHLQELGKGVVAKGAKTYNDFVSGMRELLGDMWSVFKDSMNQIWQAVKDFNTKVGIRGGIKLSNKVAIDKATGEHTTIKELEEMGLTGEEQQAYETLRNEDVENLAGHLRAMPKSQIWQGVKKELDRTLGIVSTRLGNIHPSLKVAARRYVYDVGKNTTKDSTAAYDFIHKFDKLSASDKIDLSRALINGDIAAADSVAVKADMLAALSSARSVWADIYKRAIEAGYDIGKVENYWPRVVKDPEGLLTALHGDESWSAIETAIRNKETESGALSNIEKAQIADSILRGYGDNIALTTSHAKSRKFKVVPDRYLQYYMSADQSAISYIRSMNNSIEAAKFFGKGNYAQKDVKLGLDLEIITDSDINKSIGMYVQEIKTKDVPLTARQEQELREIFTALFKPARTGQGVQLYKDLTYLQLLTQFTPAVTQIVDLALAAEQAGYINTVRAAGKAIVRRSSVTVADVGVGHIIQEFDGSVGATARLVEAGLKWTGFEFVDRFGKESLLNGVLLRMQQQAKKNDPKLVAGIEMFLGKKSVSSVMEQIKSGEKTDDVLFLLYNRLADNQPISKIEVPERYLSSNVGKVFYVLKTYQLKLLDIYRRDVFQKINAGDLDGIKKLITMTSALLALGIGTDKLKDWMMGKKSAASTFGDALADNMMRLVGFNKYAASKFKDEGLWAATSTQIAPPTGVIDPLFKDISEFVRRGTVRQGLRSAAYVPVAGKTYYWWFGRGKKISENYTPPRTKAESILRDAARKRMPKGGLTDEQQDRYYDLRELKDQYKNGSSLAAIVKEAKRRGVNLSSDDHEEIIMSRKEGAIAERYRREKLTKNATASDLLKAWEVMSDDEKKQYRALVLTKIENSETMTVEAKMKAYKEVFGKK